MNRAGMQEAGSKITGTVAVDAKIRAGAERGVGGVVVQRQKASGIVVDARKLGVIEDVEGFGAKLAGEAFADGKALEDSHIEVGGRWPKEGVASRVSVSQTRWRVVSRWVEKQRPVDAGAMRGAGDVRAADVGSEVDIGTGSLAVGDSGVIAVISIHHAEWLAGLKLGDTRPLPAAERKLRKMTVAFQLGQRVDVTDIEDMALVEIGTGAVGAEIVAIDEIAIVAIGFVVDRVTVGVGKGKFQIGRSAAR